MTGDSFHVYASHPVSYAPAAHLPFQGDVATGPEAWDDTGWYDPITWCLRIPPTVVQVRLLLIANFLWKDLPAGTQLAAHLFRNGLEIRGTDFQVFQLNASHTPQGQVLTALVTAQGGDTLDARPYQNSLAPQSLFNSLSGAGYNTCNYFEGMILKVT